MNREELFFSELESCPGLPEGQYDIICKKIRRKTAIRRFEISGTVSAVLITALLISSNLWRPEKKTIQPELAAEIQIIQEYLNGEDLEAQIQTYAYFEE